MRSSFASGCIATILLCTAPVFADATPAAPPSAAPRAPHVVAVSGSCGWGLHRTYRGYCVPNRRHYYRPYVYYPYYGYPAYPYYYGGYQPWNRPSPSDYSANWLNAQELGRSYRGY